MESAQKSPEEAVSRAMAVASGTPPSQLTVPITGEDYTGISLAMGENQEANEIQYSRLAIMQSKSPEVDTQVPGYSVGQIFDNITRDVYSVKEIPPWLANTGAEGLKKIDFSLIVPIFKLPTEFIQWRDRNKGEGTGMHWKSLDPQDPRVRAGSWPPIGHWEKPKDPNERQSPPVTQNMNFLCCVLHPISYEVMNPMVVLTFAKTNFKAGKRLYTSCMNHRMQQLPFWGKTYYLFTTFKQFPKGTAYIYNVANGPLMKKIKPEPDFEETIFAIAKGLADPTKVDANRTQGRINQEMVINSAVLMEEADEVEGEGDELAGAGADANQGTGDIPF